MFLQGIGVWVTGFDPYARTGPIPDGTLASANAELLAAWRALVSPMPLACDARTGECSIGPPGVPRSEAQMTWYVLASLVSTSCSAEDGVPRRRECFDPDQPFAPGRCSFYAPLLCANARDVLAGESLVPLRDLQIDRVRVHTRRSRARARSRTKGGT